MSDPKRLLDESHHEGEAARRLLRGGLDMGPPKGAEAAVWAGLSAQLFPGGGGGAPGAGSGGGAVKVASGAAKATGLFKAAAIGAVSAAIALTGASVVESMGAPSSTSVETHTIAEAAPKTEGAEAKEAPETLPAAEKTTESTSAPEVSPPSDSAPSKAPLAAEAPPAAAEAAEAAVANSDLPSGDSDSPSVVSLGAGSAGSAEAAAAERASRLREESLLLSQARLALRQGNARGAITLLDQAWTRFPQGILVQEREALAIEALAQSGQRTAAAQRAQMFLRAFPKSPHAERVQTFVQ